METTRVNHCHRPNQKQVLSSHGPKYRCVKNQLLVKGTSSLFLLLEVRRPKSAARLGDDYDYGYNMDMENMDMENMIMDMENMGMRNLVDYE